METSEIVKKVITRINEAKTLGSNTHLIPVDDVLKLEFLNGKLRVIVSNVNVLTLGMEEDEKHYNEIEVAIARKRTKERRKALELL